MGCTKACGSKCLAPYVHGQCPDWACCAAAKPASDDSHVILPHARLIAFQSRCTGNIGHTFHEKFWPLFWWTIVHSESDMAILVDRNLYLPACAKAPKLSWTDELFWSVARELRWTVYNRSQAEIYCAQGDLHIVRACAKHRTLRPKHLVSFGKRVIWSAVLGHEPSRVSLPDSAQRVLIYSRGRSSYRRILEPHRLKPLFDEKFDLQIVDDIPEKLVDQARLFSGSSLLLAPNGGWMPNVVFMPSQACLVELHLYRKDSWVEMFGLSSTIAELLLIVGDYSDPTKPRIVRPKREASGGDDDFLVTGGKDNLFRDIRKQMLRSRVCKAYLAKLDINRWDDPGICSNLGSSSHPYSATL